MLKTSEQEMNRTQMFDVARRFVGFARPYVWFYVGSLVAGLFVTAATLAQPWLLKLLTDNVFTGKDPVQAERDLKLICGGVVILTVIKGLFTYTQGYLTAFASQKTVTRVRDVVYRHLQSLPIPFYDKVRIGDLLNRFTSDVGVMTDSLTTGLMNGVSDALQLTFAIAWMLWKSPGMTALALVMSPFIAFAMSWFGRRINRSSVRVQHRLSDLVSKMNETLSSMKVIKSFTREEYEVRRFENINAEAFDAAMKIAQLGATQAPIVEFFGTIGVVVVVFYGGYGIIHSHFTLGDTMAFWFYMVLATNPLNRLSATYSNLRRGLVSGERIFELIDLPIEGLDRADAVQLPSLKGDVEFDRVTFSYSGEEPVLNNLSFSAKAGEMVAVVGPNGAGKTTVISLIPRFYEATGGTIRVDGYDIRDVKVRSLREQMAFVLQDNVLFTGTLRENIMYGNLDATEAEMMEAARIANCNFIDDMDKKFDYHVGERGPGLSGGQRQRISIARAILRNPRILILDEATSNLDQAAEQEVQEALERLMKGRTTFIIAHRLATIRRADRILVVDHGQVVEQGKHEDLMEAKGLYRRLYEAQQFKKSA